MPKATFFNLPEEKRAQIIDVAVAEFSEHSYRSASISRIVAQAGIAKGSFYQYFVDKADLYRYLLDQIFEKKSEFFSMEHPDPQHVGVFSYLRWMAEMGVAFERTYPRLSQIGYRAFYTGDFPEGMSDETKSRAKAFYVRLVELGKAQGDIDPAIDTGLAVFLFDAIFTNLPGHILERMAASGEENFDSARAVPAHLLGIFSQIVGILEHGMGVKERRSGGA